jgi:hypothetical protein
MRARIDELDAKLDQNLEQTAPRSAHTQSAEKLFESRAIGRRMRAHNWTQ